MKDSDVGVNDQYLLSRLEISLWLWCIFYVIIWSILCLAVWFKVQEVWALFLVEDILVFHLSVT